jgi:large subunit ribosomal protein L22
MGARKTEYANKLKEAKKVTNLAILRNCPTSPRKMRYVVDMIRGVEVSRALDILKFSNKDSAELVEKLLLSAISNWQSKNEGKRIEDSNLFVKEVFVDSGRMLKRLRTAPQGRAYRTKKRSNHVTLIIDSVNSNATQTK